MSILHCLQAKLSPLKAEHARLLGIDGYLKIPGKASKLKEVKEHVLALIIHRMDLHSMPDGGPPTAIADDNKWNPQARLPSASVAYSNSTCNQRKLRCASRPVASRETSTRCSTTTRFATCSKRSTTPPWLHCKENSKAAPRRTLNSCPRAMLDAAFLK